MRHILSLIISMQFILLPLSQAHANIVKDKLTGAAQNMFTSKLCSDKGSLACTGLDIATNDEDFLEEVVNLILIFSLVISLLDSKCSVTEAGKKMKPKSYTAGITHWIHKLSALIYIYGEIQNLITLRQIDSEYDDASKFEGQLNKFQALRDMLEAKKDAAESKLKILNIAGMGFATSAAVDVGMTAAFTAWGGYRQVMEASKCTLTAADLSACSAPGGTNAAAAAVQPVKIQDVAQKCVAEFTTLNLTDVLISEAKSRVMGTVVKGIGGVVGGAIGKKLTEKAGGGKVAQIAGTTAGVYVGAKVAAGVQSVIESQTDALTADKNNTISGILSTQPKKCIQESVKEIVTENVKSMALSTAVSTCAASFGVTCGPSIAANCTMKALLQKKSCNCALRNSAQIANTLQKITTNFSFLDRLNKDEALLDVMSTDLGADQAIAKTRVDVLTSESESEFQDKNIAWEKEDVDALNKEMAKEICGIDYSNWIIRHDLECKPMFSFLTKEDTEEVTPDEAKEKSNSDESDKNNDKQPISEEGAQNDNDESKSSSESDEKAQLEFGAAERKTDFSKLETTESQNVDTSETVGQKSSILTDQEIKTMQQEEVGKLENTQSSNGTDWQPFNNDAEREEYERHKAESNAEMDEMTKKLKEANEGDGGSLPSKDDKHKFISKLDKTLKEQAKAYKHLDQINLTDAIIGLQTSKHAQWMTNIFNNPELSNSYNRLDNNQQENIRVTMTTLLESLKALKNNVGIPSAHADTDSTSNEVSILGGLGLSAVGIFLFPKMIKKVMNMNTILHRNPLRRGVYFLTTYYMADMNIETTEKKVKELEGQLEKVDKMMEEQQSYDTTFFNILNDMFSIPKAHANVISKNLVPLCIEGAKFSTSCMCQSKGSCGNEITKVRPQSYLFSKIPAYGKTSALQLKFVNKMATGNIVASDYDALANSLKAYSSKLNPEIAAGNLDLILEERGLPKANLVQRSKNLVASLQRSGAKEIMKMKNLNVDPSKLFKNNNFTASESKDDNKKTSQKNPAQKISTAVTNNPVTAKKVVKKPEDSLNNYKLDDSVIIDNPSLDIFKVITNRYHKIWYSNK